MKATNEILEMIIEDSSNIENEEKGFAMTLTLLEIAETDIKSVDSRRAIETIDKIVHENIHISNVVDRLSGKINAFGMSAYSAGIYGTAEIAFRMLAERGNTSARNNYAYMIRRHEIVAPSKRDPVLALRLLQDGVKNGEAYAFVNTALVFALLLGDDESWHQADSIFDSLTCYGGRCVSSWWEDLAKKGDDEGFLVIFFLLRHGRIENDSFGSIKSIAYRLTKSIQGFPDWLAKEYAFETLNDVIECRCDPNFDSMLVGFLGQMPRSRESVNEMLKAVSFYDLRPVYKELLTSFVSLLTLEELTKLKADYKKIFSHSLPGED